MNIRTSKPEAGNKFYITTSRGGYSTCIQGKPTDVCNVLANCVGYACGRFNEIIGSMKYPSLNCNAENFIERARSLGLAIVSYPTLGGIMVWQKGSTLSGNDGAGHVAIVERIDSGNQIYTSESNYGSSAFYNSIRTNSNGRWGCGSAYTFRGCIVNPAIGDVHYVAPVQNVFTTGNYRCNGEMNVRSGAGTNYPMKKVKDLSVDGRKHATSSNPNADAVYKADTVFTAQQIINQNGVWAKTPSGYVCIKGASGKVYCSKI